jgi:hypothetical protein
MPTRGMKRIPLRLRFAEGDQARDVGNRVLGLQPFAVGHRLVFVAQAQVQGEVRPDLPAIVGEKARQNSVAVILRAAHGALRQVIRIVIEQVVREIGPFVVAALPLREGLRRDLLPAVEAEFEVCAPLVQLRLSAIGIGSECRSAARSDRDRTYYSRHRVRRYRCSGMHPVLGKGCWGPEWRWRAGCSQTGTR